MWQKRKTNTMSLNRKILHILAGFFLWTFFFVLCHGKVQAQEIVAPPNYFTGEVIEVLEQQTISPEDQLFIQRLAVIRNDSKERVEVIAGSEFQPINAQQLLKPGTKVVLAEQTLFDGTKEIVISDVYRMNILYWLLALFIVVVVIVGGIKGAASFLGMFASLVILLLYVIPQILSGANPLLIGLLGSLLIGSVTIYISHGVSIKSHIALVSMCSVLLLVAGLAVMAVKAAQLVGLGSEEAYFLQFTDTARINLQGLLLGGILLGALGVLDDITVSQVSIVFELFDTKKSLSWIELYERGLAVGKDHVASLVNTLVLAYAGANLPLFLLLVLNEQSPTWVTLNSDILVEEIIRTIAGSIGLVLAVPLSTFLAAQIVIRRNTGKKKH